MKLSTVIPSVLGLALMVAPAVAEKSKIFNLQAKNIDTQQIFPIGRLEYTSEAEKVTAITVADVPESLDPQQGSYCLGAEIHGAFKCYNYIDGFSLPIQYSLALITKPNGGLVSLSYEETDTPGIIVHTRILKHGPEPIVPKMKTIAGSQAPVQEDEEEEEEESKSFIQKYWMYIVPVLLIVMMAPGEEGQGAPTK